MHTQTIFLVGENGGSDGGVSRGCKARGGDCKGGQHFDFPQRLEKDQKNNTSKTDVAPRCYTWMGWVGLDISGWGDV